MDTLDSLAQEWLEWKRREEHSRDQRVAVEEKILAQHPAKEEGSESFATPGGFKVRFVSKLKYKADLDMLRVLTSTWDSELVPIKTKVEVDESRLKAIRQNNPKVWSMLAPAITTEPAKTGVSVELVKE
jgi:hypothetical protein